MASLDHSVENYRTQLIRLDSSRQEAELYLPSSKFGVPLTGFIRNFSVTAVLPSIPVLQLADTDATFSERQQTNADMTTARITPSKELWFFLVKKQIEIPLFPVWLFNTPPAHEENLMPRLKAEDWFHLENGVTLKAKITPSGSLHTPLEGNDIVTILVNAFEENKVYDLEVKSFTPRIYTLVLDQANTEYSFVLPDRTRGYIFKCRGDSEDIVSLLRYSWEAGKVLSSEGYDVLPENAEEGEPFLPPISGKTLFFSAPVSGTVVVIKIWKEEV